MLFPAPVFFHILVFFLLNMSGLSDLGIFASAFYSNIINTKYQVAGRQEMRVAFSVFLRVFLLFRRNWRALAGMFSHHGIPCITTILEFVDFSIGRFQGGLSIFLISYCLHFVNEGDDRDRPSPGTDFCMSRLRTGREDYAFLARNLDTVCEASQNRTREWEKHMKARGMRKEAYYI